MGRRGTDGLLNGKHSFGRRNGEEEGEGGYRHSLLGQGDCISGEMQVLLRQWLVLLRDGMSAPTRGWHHSGQDEDEDEAEASWTEVGT